MDQGERLLIALQSQSGQASQEAGQKTTCERDPLPRQQLQLRRLLPPEAFRDICERLQNSQSGLKGGC